MLLSKRFPPEWAWSDARQSLYNNEASERPLHQDVDSQVVPRHSEERGIWLRAREGELYAVLPCFLAWSPLGWRICAAAFAAHVFAQISIYKVKRNRLWPADEEIYDYNWKTLNFGPISSRVSCSGGDHRRGKMTQRQVAGNWRSPPMSTNYFDKSQQRFLLHYLHLRPSTDWPFDLFARSSVREMSRLLKWVHTRSAHTEEGNSTLLVLVTNKCKVFFPTTPTPPHPQSRSWYPKKCFSDKQLCF